MSFLVILSAAVHVYYGRMLTSYEGSFCSFALSKLFQNREAFLLSLPCSGSPFSVCFVCFVVLFFPRMKFLRNCWQVSVVPELCTLALDWSKLM